MLLNPSRLLLVCCWSYCCLLVSSSKVLLDSKNSGALHLQSISNEIKSDNIVALISSPGTLSSIVDTISSDDKDFFLALDDGNQYLYCKGPTMSTIPNSPELLSIATCSMVASTIVLDGITEGDVEDSGLPNSRHAVTLTMLFRARLQQKQQKELSKQGLILCIPLGADHDDQNLINDIQAQVELLYAAVAAENKESLSVQFEDLYDLQIEMVSLNDSEKVIKLATEKANSLQQQESTTLSTALLYAQKKIQESSIISIVVNPPHIASALINVMNSYTKQSRAIRAKIESWKSRSSRGLLIDNFGAQAEMLIQKALDNYDRETLSAVGLTSSETTPATPLGSVAATVAATNNNVANSRKVMRIQLKHTIENIIPSIYEEQVAILQSMTLNKFRNQLLKNTISGNTQYDDQQKMIDNSATIVRAAALLFDTKMEELQINSLGLSAAKECRKFSNILNNELATFPDSPMAKLKLSKKMNKVITREKRKPQERAVQFGLDLVAMLRPDGFGSLQGFCGYQLGGNSITFGVHNDADDPQVISQFGGVRPPLLRVQPKLRVDVEL